MSSIKRNPSVMYKLGYTTVADAEIRFSEEYHEQNNFEGVCLGRDFHVRCVWSGYFPKTQADSLEAEWKEKYPKTLWTDIQYNGITECRYFEYEEYLTVLNKYRSDYPKPNYSFKAAKAKYGYTAQLVKVYLMEFKKKFDEGNGNN